MPSHAQLYAISSSCMLPYPASFSVCHPVGSQGIGTKGGIRIRIYCIRSTQSHLAPYRNLPELDSELGLSAFRSTFKFTTANYTGQQCLASSLYIPRPIRNSLGAQRGGISPKPLTLTMFWLLMPKSILLPRTAPTRLWIHIASRCSLSPPFTRTLAYADSRCVIYQDYTDEKSQNFLTDVAVKEKFSSAKKLSEVSVNDYDAIFYVGGHGPVIDLASDPVNIQLASQFWQEGKIVSAVCHGPAAIVGATDSNGESIFKGKEVTGFSNDEEIAVDQVKAIPFLLEDRIKLLGGKYTKADEPWGPKVVTDGKLITGQNPASAQPIGEAILVALRG